MMGAGGRSCRTSRTSSGCSPTPPCFAGVITRSNVACIFSRCGSTHLYTNT
uniref:Uncharacterized protein n=1 Tax=Arundo donax TaxID=35708 RepID=A0A0A9B044_ARUDO